MSYRPLTDVMILGRSKVKYFGAYPAGFLQRARDLLVVTANVRGVRKDCVKSWLAITLMLAGCASQQPYINPTPMVWEQRGDWLGYYEDGKWWKAVRTRDKKCACDPNETRDGRITMLPLPLPDFAKFSPPKRK